MQNKLHSCNTFCLLNAACIECRATAASMPRRYFLERTIAFLKFLHITYIKTTILIKRFFRTPCGSHESKRQRSGSGRSSARQRRGILCIQCKLVGLPIQVRHFQVFLGMIVALILIVDPMFFRPICSQKYTFWLLHNFLCYNSILLKIMNVEFDS
jgi:hypothetical protein